VEILMRLRVCRPLAAGVLLFSAVAVSAAASAQVERGSGAPNAPAQEDAAPSPQGAERPAPEGEPQARPNGNDMQHGCPDQRRPLQLIV
jgi:hypothetical protein